MTGRRLDEPRERAGVLNMLMLRLAARSGPAAARVAAMSHALCAAHVTSASTSARAVVARGDDRRRPGRAVCPPAEPVAGEPDAFDDAIQTADDDRATAPCRDQNVPDQNGTAADVLIPKKGLANDLFGADFVIKIACNV